MLGRGHLSKTVECENAHVLAHPVNIQPFYLECLGSVMTVCEPSHVAGGEGSIFNVNSGRLPTVHLLTLSKASF